jgi:hypothetical protein
MLILPNTFCILTPDSVVTDVCSDGSPCVAAWNDVSGTGTHYLPFAGRGPIQGMADIACVGTKSVFPLVTKTSGGIQINLSNANSSFSLMNGYFADSTGGNWVGNLPRKDCNGVRCRFDELPLTVLVQATIKGVFGGSLGSRVTGLFNIDGFGAEVGLFSHPRQNFMIYPFSSGSICGSTDFRSFVKDLTFSGYKDKKLIYGVSTDGTVIRMSINGKTIGEVPSRWAFNGSNFLNARLGGWFPGGFDGSHTAYGTIFHHVVAANWFPNEQELIDVCDSIGY